MQRHAYTNLTKLALTEPPPVMRFGLDGRDLPGFGYLLRDRSVRTAAMRPASARSRIPTAAL